MKKRFSIVVILIMALLSIQLISVNYFHGTVYANPYEICLSSLENIPSEIKKDILLEQAIINEFHLEEYDDNIRYYYNKVDLNDDGNPEIFVYLVGSSVCGTGGCSGAIFKQEDKEYKLLSRFSLVRNPVIISNTKTNGYRDIIMHISGGGIESFFAQLKYDGTTYPSNPSIEPEINPNTKLEGIAIIADDTTKNPGIKLEILNKWRIKILNSLDTFYGI